MDTTDAELIAAVRRGEIASFEVLIARYSPRVFATVRRYARLEREVEDISQEIWIKAFRKLGSYQGAAPFEHWLMRLAVRTCYDFLRSHQRHRERAFTELSGPELDWLETFAHTPDEALESAAGARALVKQLLGQMSPAARLIITLLEIEERPIREIATLTGWSVPLVKVRAFRARKEMKRLLAQLAKEKYL